MSWETALAAEDSVATCTNNILLCLLCPYNCVSFSTYMVLDCVPQFTPIVIFIKTDTGELNLALLWWCTPIGITVSIVQIRPLLTIPTSLMMHANWHNCVYCPNTKQFTSKSCIIILLLNCNNNYYCGNYINMYVCDSIPPKTR